MTRKGKAASLEKMLHRLSLLSLALAGSILVFACADDEVTTEGGGGDGAGTLTAGGDQGGTSSQGAGDPNGGSDSGGGGGVVIGNCPATPTCSAPYPDVGPERDWNHTSSSITASFFDIHRGRDMFYNPGNTIWVIAKFAYGPTDKDIHDEEVDIYLNRDCSDQWELVGTELTTEDEEHPTVEGVEDSGGWVFFDATSLNLGEGRHRFLMVVAGDLTTTEVLVEVIKPGTPIVISDVDGTLTTEETEEFSALASGDLPQSNVDSANVLQGLAEKGYRIYYVTARPEFLVQRTRDFLKAHQYPPGLVHATLNTTGATGEEAVVYKTGELAAIAARGLVPAWAFGNTETDAEAYNNGNILPLQQRIMFQFTDKVYGARRIEAYTELLPEVAASSPVVCP